MINDEEGLLRALQAYIKANLNTRIAAINAEKGDFEIDEITADDDHYVFSGELLDWPNHTFVNLAVDGDIEVISNHNDKASLPTIYIEVAFDNPKKPNTYFKSLRYMRALYETILNFEASAVEVDDVRITKAIPMIVTRQSRQLVVSGVSLSVSIN